MEERITFRCSTTEWLFLRELALAASTPKKDVRVADIIRKLIAQEMAKHQLETREAA